VAETMYASPSVNGKSNDTGKLTSFSTNPITIIIGTKNIAQKY
jgi:hypothetical protein